ncbi:armadillo-type protein [Mycena latifolia]|nr:armadillo-type protein [Mycena latifolia]
MPPLTRQRTLESVLSWWSDSNPAGATINLHAAAKPLMKLMYDRQALAFMKRNRGVALSQETVEIYWSYVAWKYVSASTKLAILEDLKIRAGSKEDVRVLIYSNVVDKILQLLRSSSKDMRWRIIRDLGGFLGGLASHSKSIGAAVIEIVVALLRVTDTNDVAVGFDLLSEIAGSSGGAEGIVAANALHYLLDGLESPSAPVRLGACRLAEALANCRAMDTPAADKTLSPSYALLAIANWPDGAEEVVAARALDTIAEHLASSKPRVLARHKSTAEAVLDLKPCERLVTLLREVFLYVPAKILKSLHVANWPTGAEAVVAAQVLDHVAKCFASRHSSICQSVCQLLGKLAWHKSTAQAVARAVPRERLIGLSRDEEYDNVRASADNALQALDDYLADHGALQFSRL